MTKDYAKRKNTHYTSKPSSRGSKAIWQENTKSILPPFVWLSLGMIFGLLIAGATYWKLNQFTIHTKIPSLIQTDKKSAPVAKLDTKESKKTAEATRFDFYTLLPNMNVELSELNPNTQPESTPGKEDDAASNRDRQTTEARPPSVVQLTPTVSESLLKQSFIIQVASFKKHDQAESLKARLALSGFESKIKPIKISSGEVWYRLYLGPFPDRISAQNTQEKLESEQKMNSLVVKINV